jgi:ATP-binding cassette subfamily B protein
LRQGWLGASGKGAALLLLPDGEGEEHTSDSADPEGMWRFIWQHLHFYRPLLYLLFGGVVLASLLAVAAPFLAQAVVDMGMPNRDLPLIALLLVGQLALGLGQLALQWGQNWLLMQLGSRFQVNLLSGFLRRLTLLPQRFFDRRQTGDLLQRVEDHQRIEQWVASDLVRIVYYALFGAVFSVVLLLYHPLLFVVFFAFSAVYVLWVLLFLRSRRVIDQERFGQLADHQETLLETIRGMPDVKLQGSRERHYGKWGQVQWRLFRTNLRGLYIRQLQDGGAGIINQVKDLLLLFLAAKGVVDGDMTLGMFVAVQFIIGQLNVPVAQLVPFIRATQDARISLERVRAVREEAPEAPEDAFAPIPMGPIQLNGVSFRYLHAGPWVLDDIRLHFPEGKKVAVVGPSGSGKTTLLRLLLGLYVPVNGEVRIGAAVLSPLNLLAWRAQCGAALQDGFLFSDTISQNIAESDEAPDRERVIHAARQAQLHDFIQTLPQGYETLIGPKGVQLSQGQRQRILLARAWYRNPGFWVLDEATSALDGPTEDAVWEALSKQTPAPTIVFSSHRLQTVQRADWVVVLENGKVVQEGPIEALMQFGSGDPHEQRAFLRLFG